MTKKKKLSLEALENLKSSSALSERDSEQKNLEEGKKVEEVVQEKSEDPVHQKVIKYPKNWHRKIVEARKSGVTSLRETSYILEAIRQKMTSDGLI